MFGAGAGDAAALEPTYPRGTRLVGLRRAHPVRRVVDLRVRVPVQHHDELLPRSRWDEYSLAFWT